MKYMQFPHWNVSQNLPPHPALLNETIKPRHEFWYRQLIFRLDNKLECTSLFAFVCGKIVTVLFCNPLSYSEIHKHWFNWLRYSVGHILTIVWRNSFLIYPSDIIEQKAKQNRTELNRIKAKIGIFYLHVLNKLLLMSSYFQFLWSAFPNIWRVHLYHFSCFNFYKTGFWVFPDNWVLLGTSSWPVQSSLFLHFPYLSDHLHQTYWS